MRLALALILVSVSLPAQSAPKETTEEILTKGTIVVSNVDKAVQEHEMFDPDFQPLKQNPEDKREFPVNLFYKNGDFAFDWTQGQRARYLMEDIRQGLHALRAAAKPRGFDAIAFAGGREYWPKLRDISCQESPGIRYYDLDGFEQYCPTK